MTSNANFRVTYEGSALDLNEMDARDLAGALFALGDLCESAGTSLFHNNAWVSVRVKANFKEGSFNIDLLVIHNWISALIDKLNSKDASAVSNAKAFLDILGLVGGAGLISLMKRLKGEKPSSMENTGNKMVIFVMPTGERIEEREEIRKLFQDPGTRKNLSKFVEPLGREGVEEIRFGEEDSQSSIRKEEAAYFDYFFEEESLLEETRDMYFEVVSPVFKKGLKWKLSDGSSSFFVSILDEGFLDEVEAGTETFAKGDTLKCVVHVIQSMQDERLKADYQVIKVLNHTKKRTPGVIPLK